MQSDSVNFGNCQDNSCNNKKSSTLYFKCTFLHAYSCNFWLVSSQHLFNSAAFKARTKLRNKVRDKRADVMWGWRRQRERNTTSLKSPRLTWNYSLTYCQARNLTKCVRDWLCLPVCECERPGVCMRCCFYLTSQCVIARNPAIKQNMKYCIFVTTYCKAVLSFSVETCFITSRVFGKKIIFIINTFHKLFTVLQQRKMPRKMNSL